MAMTKLLSCFESADCLDFYRTRLAEDASRLFSTQNANIRVLVYSSTERRLEDEVVHDAAAMEAFLQRIRNKTYDNIFYILKQKDSWSRFNATKEMCEQMLRHHDVFLPFFDCLHSFGYKTTEDTHIWDGFYCTAGPLLETCYSLRFYEKNGRASGDPWSLRQTAIYNQYDKSNNRWSWILLQPSASFLSQLEKSLVHCAGCQDRCDLEPLSIHRMCLTLGLGAFGGYVDTLHADVVQMSHKACFSVVGKHVKHDFVISFQDVQRLQLLEQRLLRALSVLKSNSKLCGKLRRHHLNSVGSVKGMRKSRSLHDLENCNSLIDVYVRRVSMSLEFAREASVLMSSVLGSRHDEVLLRTSTATQGNLEVLKRIAFISGEENQKLSRITAQTLKDSSTLKALTTIATMYLPASLIATIFSSSLVQLQPQMRNQDVGKGFAIATEFWIYVVSTILLTLITGGVLLLLSKPWRTSSGPIVGS